MEEEVTLLFQFRISYLYFVQLFFGTTWPLKTLNRKVSLIHNNKEIMTNVKRRFSMDGEMIWTIGGLERKELLFR